jgi:hypothetical protein
MRLVRIAGIAAALAACSLAVSCGGGGHSDRHAAEKATPAPPAPTPDTTPIEALRTPAGLVLKINEPPTPTPAGRLPTPGSGAPIPPTPASPVSPAATPAPGSAKAG